jgi:hypothetical protein
MQDSKHDNLKHDWRKCPFKQHAVTEHTNHYKPSKAHPEGSQTIIHATCAINKSGKDELRFEEIQIITEHHIKILDVQGSELKYGVKKFLAKFGNGDDFDKEILGWTKYWNEVLLTFYKEDDMSEPLDPNIVKALIASESGFHPVKFMMHIMQEG